MIQAKRLPLLILLLKMTMLCAGLMIQNAVAQDAMSERSFDQACETYNRYQFGNRIDRLIEMHGQDEFDRRMGALCSCYLEAMADVGMDETAAISTFTRIVDEDALFSDPMPDWYLAFDEQTYEAFKQCNVQASEPGA
ncbi:MAG: hypothetical protein AAGH65_07795 [Pseudomonadota bacterium]